MHVTKFYTVLYRSRSTQLFFFRLRLVYMFKRRYECRAILMCNLDSSSFFFSFAWLKGDAIYIVVNHRFTKNGLTMN